MSTYARRNRDEERSCCFVVDWDYDASAPIAPVTTPLTPHSPLPSYGEIKARMAGQCRKLMVLRPPGRTSPDPVGQWPTAFGSQRTLKFPLFLKKNQRNLKEIARSAHQSQTNDCMHMSSHAIFVRRLASWRSSSALRRMRAFALRNQGAHPPPTGPPPRGPGAFDAACPRRAVGAQRGGWRCGG